MTTDTQELVLKEELKKETNNAVAKANAMTVVDNKTNEVASNFLKNLKTLQKEIEAELAPGIEKAFNLHRTLVDQRKRFLAPLQAAEQAIKTKISIFLVEEEQKRLEAQRKAQAAAEAAERKRKAELEAQAKAHEAAGRTEKAEERRQLAQETFIPTPIVESTVEKQKGVSTIQVWKFEITDENLVPREYLMVDEKAIGQVVRALKDKAKIPGVRVYSTNEVRARA